MVANFFISLQLCVKIQPSVGHLVFPFICLPVIYNGIVYNISTIYFMLLVESEIENGTILFCCVTKQKKNDGPEGLLPWLMIGFTL